MIFTILVKRTFHAYPYRFGFNDACVFCLGSIRSATGFPLLSFFGLARHCSWHRNFKFVPRIVHSFFELRICWVKEVDTLQPSSIVKVWTNLKESSSNIVNRVNPVHESDGSRSPSIFQKSSMRRSSITSKVVLVALVTSMYRGGIWSDSAFGTHSLTFGST